jgi:hypothetical protein
MAKINVLNREVTITQIREDEYICLTDIAKHRNADDPRFIIQNWMRTRSTVEFLGIWEFLNNPDFNRVDFEAVKKEFQRLKEDERKTLGWDIRRNLALFGKTAAQWRDANPDKKGNMRDEADVTQLVCLSNLENLNALFIAEGLSQQERLERLNKIAIHQMTLLAGDERMNLPGGGK